MAGRSVIGRLLTRLALAVLTLAALAVLALWLLLRASLPTEEGSATLAGLTGAVSVERDAEGVPTVSGRSRIDLARALGYLHGQDRFFQMDLTRRAAAGELSALLGAATLPTDLRLRVHRFRSVARAVVEHASPEIRGLAEAYAEGVNAGLASLGSRPPEYWLLGARPQPWRAEDSVLVAHSMYLQLQDGDGHAQIQRGIVKAALPDAAFRFVYGGAPEWDAALDASRAAEPVVPSAEVYSLRSRAGLEVDPPAGSTHHVGALGSNNWAIAGAHSTSHAALVANDMHLGHRMPNVWYRVRLRNADPKAPLDITGVTLPGTPLVVAGSNGHIAWGFTNSYGDFSDVVLLVPGAAGHYRTATGEEPFETVEERIEVHGAQAVPLTITSSRFGPVIARDAAGRALALSWSAHDWRSTNLEIVGLESAGDVAAAFAVAARVGMPAQNLAVGDASGRIGWTIAGQLPVHPADPLRGPSPSTDPEAGLRGYQDEARRPHVVDPADGFIYTANARVVGGAGLDAIGDGGYYRGARAQQIHEDLLAAGMLAPKDSLAVQLDGRARFLARWKTLLEGLLDEGALGARPPRAEMKHVIASWTGQAAVDDAAYRLVGAFREEVEARAWYMLIAPARAQAPDFHFIVPDSFEGPLWRLLDARPEHLLAARYKSWRDFLLQAADAAAVLPGACATLADCSYGRVHYLVMQHPLSKALGPLGRVLDMPRVPLPGDNDMPRVHARTWGASERFDVSPGHEAEGIFEMPGGQSGHPLSPYYRAGHDAWLGGRPTPFLPGATAHRLELKPPPT
jgi:penicillin G amidase